VGKKASSEPGTLVEGCSGVNAKAPFGARTISVAAFRGRTEQCHQGFGKGAGELFHWEWVNSIGFEGFEPCRLQAGLWLAGAEKPKGLSNFSRPEKEYRRPLHGVAPADWKSAIRQTRGLRYVTAFGRTPAFLNGQENAHRGAVAEAGFNFNFAAMGFDHAPNDG